MRCLRASVASNVQQALRTCARLASPARRKGESGNATALRVSTPDYDTNDTTRWVGNIVLIPDGRIVAKLPIGSLLDTMRPS
jgi:hypothetical protein